MTPTADMARMAHTLRCDGLAWTRVHTMVCVRFGVRRDAFSVRDLLDAHAALFPRHRYPLGPAVGGEGGA